MMLNKRLISCYCGLSFINNVAVSKDGSKLSQILVPNLSSI